MMHQLANGRVVQSVIRDEEGRARFFEILDTRTNSRRIFFGPNWTPQKERSRSAGYAIGEDDVPRVMEFYFEDEQCYWRKVNEKSDIILLPGAFAWCAPQEGDKLQDQDGREYTVQGVPEGAFDCPWNGVVLLDLPVQEGAIIRWVGEARSRALVKFVADDGHPYAPTGPGEDTGGDVGTGYSQFLAPTITYLLELQEPASIGPKPFGRDKESKSLIRGEFRDHTRPQVILQVRGQRFDNLFSFRCIHPRAAVAMHLAGWFKRFIKNNTPSLRSSGLNDLQFWRQEAERRKSRSGDDVSVQRVECYIRTEELTLTEISALRTMDTRISLATNQAAYEAITGMNPQDEFNPYTGIYDQTGGYLWGSLSIDDNRGTGIPSAWAP